ncbi:MAG: acyltransferase [Xanthomonadales bacterium]|nr:acyltransferase [Xanthomonadales bacterium]
MGGITSSQSQSGYMPQLDGLRALSVIAVMYTHFLKEKYWLFDVYWGGIGVRCFFVLSGFLITGILLRENARIDHRSGSRLTLIRQFYIRRYLRLTPVFIATLLLAAIINIPNTRETFWWHVIYLSNFNFAISNSWQGAVSHFWTLAVEEQFYLIWPFFILLIPVKALIRVICLIIPLVLVYRLTAHSLGANDILVWVMLPDSMDALCSGALVAILVRYCGLKSTQKASLVVAGICLTFWIYLQVFDLSGYLHSLNLGATAIAVFFAWLILHASEGHSGVLGRVLTLPALTFIGKISYGIYVLHNFVFYVLVFHMPNFKSLNPVLMAVLGGLATMTIASLSWFLLEKPINNFRHSINYHPHTNCQKPRKTLV